MFEFVTNLFGGDSKPADAPAPAPAAAAPAVAPTQAPAQAQDPHAPAAPTTPATGAAPDPTAKKPVDQKAAADAANTIFKKMDGWWVSGSDKSAVLDTLRGKSPEEVAAIKASYAEHFPGHDMDKDLGKNLDGKDLAEAKASMSGDPVAASVAAIKNAETGTFFGNVDNDKVTKVLEGISDPKVRAEVAKQVGGEVSGMQSGNDKELTQALLAGDTAKANAVKIDSSMNSTGYGIAQFANKYVAGGLLGKDFGLDKDGINTTLESVKDPAERQKMMDDYKAKTGKDLRADVTGKLDGANKDVTNKLLDGDVAAANAARVKAATESFFTDKDAIYKAMDGKSPAERTAMMADFKNMYGDKGGDLDKTLKDNLSGLDLDKANQLKDKGKLDDAFAMKYAMEGSFWSTDKTLLKSTLAGKSKEQIAALSADYKAKYGIDLQGELNQDTSGRDGFEIKELMKGEPTNIDEKMDRARARYDFERGSGSNPISKAVVDTFSDKGQMLDAQNARMEDLYKQIQSGGASADQKALLDRVTGYQGQDTKTYQENKDSVSNGAAAVAAIAASTAATIATGGAAAPAEVAIIAALAGGGATIATKLAIQDQGYSNEEMRNDLIMTGVNAATGGAMGALGAEGGALFNAAGKMAESPIAQQMIIQGVSGAVTSGVGGATGAMLQGGDAKAMLKAGGMGALGGGVTGAVTGGVGAGLKGNQMFEGMDPVKAAMLRNAIAGGAGGVAGTAVDPASYKGDSAALIQKWGLAVGGGAAGGAAGGYNEGTAEVQNAAKLATEEQQAAATKQASPTADEKTTIEAARENTMNPAEAKVVDQVEADLAAGKNPKLPVEQAPGGASIEDKAPAVEVKTPVAEEGKAPVVEETKAPAAEKPTEVVADVDTVDVKKSEAAAEPVAAPKSDQGDRDAIIELSRQAKTPEERAQIAKWAEEIDANNPKPMQDSLRELNIEGRADGRLDPTEGSALKEWGHEANLDRMPMLDALEINGMDKAALQKVFEKAALNDASTSYKPGDKGVHTASDGTPLAVPGSSDANALTPAEMDMLLDAQGRRNDQLHPAYTTSNGRELEGTPMRKVVNDQTAAEYQSGKRADGTPTDKIGGDVGAASNTDGQGSARVAATLGLDYPHSSNQFFDPNTNTWVDSIYNDGIQGIETPMNQAMKDSAKVPFGQDVEQLAKARGRALAADGQYVPELFQSTQGPNGEEVFPHIGMRNKESELDPRTGFGFSATERAIDPKTNQPYPIIPNQEHNSAWVEMDDYDVKKIDAN